MLIYTTNEQTNKASKAAVKPSTMRHSKSKKTEKRQKTTEVDRQAPITLADLRAKEPPFEKNSLTTRSVSIRLIPADADSTTIKRNIQVLDNPINILQVLRHRKAMEEAYTGNNVTTGPTQYGFVRQFLTGESLRVFNEGATTAGNETTGNLTLALNHLVTFNCPNQVLSKQTEYIKTQLYKPHDLTTRQYVGFYRNLNSMNEQLPPLFNDTQEIEEREMIILLASKLPKEYKKMLTSQGYNPENGSMEDLIDYCERVEINLNVELGATSKKKRYDSSDESDARSSRRHKTKKKEKYQSKPNSFYCKYHGRNETHDTSECKVLNNGPRENQRHGNNSRTQTKRNGDWKDPKHKEKKYKKELHLMETKAKRYKKQLAKLNVESDSDESVPMKPKARKKHKKYVHPGSESSSESESSDSDSDDNNNYSTPKQGATDSSSSSSEDDN